jgi:hypothetical protein
MERKKMLQLFSSKFHFTIKTCSFQFMDFYRTRQIQDRFWASDFGYRIPDDCNNFGKGVRELSCRVFFFGQDKMDGLVCGLQFQN